MPWVTYDAFRLARAKGVGGAGTGYDLGATGTAIHLSLHTATYVPNREDHDFFDDVTNEVSGSGYVAGGLLLTNKTLTLSGNWCIWAAADAVWQQAVGGFTTARTGVLRFNTGVAGTSPLIAYLSLGIDRRNTVSPGLIIALSQGILIF